MDNGSCSHMEQGFYIMGLISNQEKVIFFSQHKFIYLIEEELSLLKEIVNPVGQSVSLLTRNQKVSVQFLLESLGFLSFLPMCLVWVPF